MNVAAFLTWIGRFVFLALFYYFLYNVYRSLVEVHGGSTPRAYLKTFSGNEQEFDLWIEEQPGQKRTITETVSVAIGSSLRFGRAQGNQLRTDDPYVSGRHFSVRQERNGYVLEDLGSTNGTCLDGVKITGSVRLYPGCEIAAGSFLFRFEVT